ncbi:MAG: hypothetical protein LBH59_09100, partial [Planctomycetaceae bacterium]|nr:hypothetical protein [Planctomycetaceae bacterium]
RFAKIDVDKNLKIRNNTHSLTARHNGVFSPTVLKIPILFSIFVFWGEQGCVQVIVLVVRALSRFL